MTHPNVEVRNIDQAMESGDLEKFFSYSPEDVATHIGGRSKLVGDYKGRDQLQDTFERFMEAVGPDYSFENHAYLADDEHGVVPPALHSDPPFPRHRRRPPDAGSHLPPVGEARRERRTVVSRPTCDPAPPPLESP
jgi:hypothetical protein